MARVSEAEIRALKREISVERLAEARGVKLKKHGKDLIGLCPFHDDHEPSLVITPERNLWHCLGACQAGGSVIDWVMRAEAVSFRHAVELLRKDLPSLAAEAAESAAKPPPKKTLVPKLPPVVEQVASDQELLVEVVDYYHQTLLESPEARAYLDKRGLGSEEAIRHFRLGFANRTLSYRLPSRNQRTGSELRAALERLGRVSRERARAPERLSGRPDLRRGGPGGGALRAEDHAAPAQRHAAAPVLAGAASRRLELAGAAGVEGDHPVREPDRRMHVLVRGPPQRHRGLRRGGLHGRSP